ncbi:daptide biosynthesis intramembrane metalloprotease [Actinomyces naeslundii]|uniref:daptide biosynthesis intramembrane metalloprotease n=1 Tax=Actinomyces naeslundii TaxID=1655 RepID=UPI001177E972|nr:daptide biosynthesis intramembrane metalloprotease [Actinomyces naeslundii]
MADTTATIPTHLRLATGVEVHRPLDKGAGWMVRRADQRLLNVTPELGELLQILQNTSCPPTVAELASLAPDPWTPREVMAAVQAMEPHGLLAGREQLAPLRRHRFSFDHDGLFILKICDNNADAFFRRLKPWAVRLRYSPLRWAPPLISLVGILPLVQAVSASQGTLYQPLEAITYLGIIAALVMTTVVHEFAHGLTLTACGRLPRRFGVMLFYFSPAAFCDVTDIWLLRRCERVAVASAGIIAQTFLGAGCLIIAPAFSGDLAAGLTWYGAMTYLGAMTNMLPFLKLDGYIALVGWLNRSNLRRDSMRALRNRLAGLSHRDHPTTPRCWLALFGLGCVITPILLVWLGLSAISPFLTQFGPIGKGLLIALVVAVVVAAALQGGRALASVSTGYRLRLVVAGTLLTGLILLLPVGTSHSRGYITQQDGSLLARTETTSPEAATGTSVDLHRAGLLNGPSLTTGTVTGSQRCRIPVSAVSPIRSEALMPEATCLQITPATAQPPGSTGRITIVHPPRPFGFLVWKQIGSLVSALTTS